MAAIISALAGGGLKGVAEVIDAIRGKNPEDAAKLAQINADLQAMQIKYVSDFQLAEINENVALNQAAAANIQAEAKAGWYTSAARPSIIWVGLFMFVWNYIVVPLIGIKAPALKPVALPDMFMQVWCICATGYVFSRSADKLFGGAGGSINLPFGIKFDSKGDTPVVIKK